MAATISMVVVVLVAVAMLAAERAVI